MSVSLRRCVPPQPGQTVPAGAISAMSTSNQKSAPSTATRDGHPLEDLGRGDHAAAVLAEQHGDRHAPGALARDAPVGAVGDHPRDALATPRGDPAHAVDLLEGRRAQPPLLHRDEPLAGRAEDHRVLAAPAVRVAVGDLPLAQQVAGVANGRDDDGVGVEDLLAGHALDVGGEPPPVVHGAVDVETVPLPDHVVLLAVARSGVDQTRAGLEGDVVAEDEARLAVEVRVTGDEPFEVGPAHLAHDRRRPRARHPS